MFVFLNDVKDIHHNIRLGAIRRSQLSMEECLLNPECEMIPNFVNRFASQVWCNNNCVQGNGKNCEKACQCVKKGNFAIQIVIFDSNFYFDRI